MPNAIPTALLRRHVVGTRTSATYDALTTSEVPRNFRWHVHELGAWDETTDVALVVVYIVAENISVPVADFTLTDKTQPHVAEVDVWLDYRDLLSFRFYDGTLADALHAYVAGTAEIVTVDGDVLR